LATSGNKTESVLIFLTWEGRVRMRIEMPAIFRNYWGCGYSDPGGWTFRGLQRKLWKGEVQHQEWVQLDCILWCKLDETRWTGLKIVFLTYLVWNTSTLNKGLKSVIHLEQLFRLNSPFLPPPSFMSEKYRLIISEFKKLF